ncbi:aldo/keto reductase [Pseudacidobacterium ailaaui]|jgi:aryl-alcohol dehydrogenase-like predicted oxidoreductase|uniref:aldo/keto reductase n=1 Tax=Pseudacidobacterium ailaaui TaxID=1382359 RepID=UPI00047E7054|nr:aldo/keto reductase [Pseudacidobacterium ailaaui]MDI3255051.1 aldo/keto reductase [Bacillota bacterium]
MDRRQFLTTAAASFSATCLDPTTALPQPVEIPVLTRKFKATDIVVLGKTGIRTSRLAMGTGTIGYGGSSNQTRNGSATRLLLNGYNNGLLFFDTADSYGSHPYVAEALQHIPREKVTVMTKCDSRDPKAARADLYRFLKELKTDYIDICLIHCVTEDDWTERYRGVMDVFSEAKEKGIIRHHGVSCHSIGALRAAAKSPWVEIDLVRLNPVGAYMDADPHTVMGVIQEMRTQGKGIVGMKILGQGAMRTRQDEALRFALGTGVLDAFTIGAENIEEQEDLIRRIAAA